MGSAEQPLRLTFEANNTHWDAIASLALSRFLSGEEPFVEEFRVAAVLRATDPLPVGSVVRRVTDADTDRALARGPGWSAFVIRYRNGAADVSVSAVGEEELAKAVAEVRARCPVEEPKPNSVPVEFWFTEQNCRPKHVRRRIDGSPWADIAGNYPAAVREKVGQLAEMPAPDAGGRLLLWHGPPGTGKTTAIRALARAW